jgi:hypothetical protein
MRAAGSVAPDILDQIGALSLGAAFEVACTASSPVPPNEWCRRLMQRFPIVSTAFECLEGKDGEAPELWSAPRVEVAAVPSSMQADDGSFFQDRFRRSLKVSGFGPASARLSAALGEMADNVLRHSGATETRPSRGIWGYHVEPGWMCFVVADLGRGVLNSLRSNPKYQHLPTADDALFAAVRQSASRTDSAGTGFLSVFKSLASYSGLLRFRSDDATLRLDGRTHFHATRAKTPFLRGFQVEVSCSIEHNEGERAV